MTTDFQLPEPYAAASQKPEFIGIPLKNMKTDAVLGAQLFIKINRDKYVKYRDADLQFDAGVRSRLRARKHTHIYIKNNDIKSLNSYIEANLVNILESRDILVSEKAEVLHDTMTHLTMEIIVDPGNKDNIQLSKQLVKSATAFMLTNSNILDYLLELSTVDYYTYSHCVDVMISSIMLGRKLGIKDEQKLVDLGHSALLHDFGKSFVNPEVTQKPGPLNEEEFAEMKLHPDFGYEALNSTNELPESVLQVVRKHHEDLKGNGYPHRLSAPHIGKDVRIVTCCDIFNALTTRRVYRKAYNVYPALKIMKDMVNSKIDSTIFSEFVKMLGGIGN
ncbi:HD domain-containing protein [bacterium]|nr:HD domain-containing protein [bacterium]